MRTLLKTARSTTSGLCEHRNRPTMHLVAEIEVLDFGGDERLAELRGGEGEGRALALQLQNVGALDLGAALLGDRALGAAELQRGQAVAVHDRVRVRRVGILAGPHDQPGLAVRIDALANQLDPGLQDEVAAHPLPHEVELVALRPHVGAARQSACSPARPGCRRPSRQSSARRCRRAPSNSPSGDVWAENVSEDRTCARDQDRRAQISETERTRVRALSMGAAIIELGIRGFRLRAGDTPARLVELCSPAGDP